MHREDAARKRTGDRRPAFIVWLSYQRRAEVLAPLLGCGDVAYFPHRFRGRLLRCLDYAIDLFQTIGYLRRSQPSYVVLQAPPLFSAISALIARTPYVIDVHNGIVQSFWSSIPLTQTLLRHAVALIAHNSEIATILQDRVPATRVLTIQDPIRAIGSGARPRKPRTILFICSFDRDEPVELILDVICALPEYTFTITANLLRLPRALRLAFEQRSNLHLPGFLKTEDYHAALESTSAAVVLSTVPSVQPSGAVEALSSNTPLIVSRTTLTESLFGEWALLCENSVEPIVAAIRSVEDARLDLEGYRSRWNNRVRSGITDLQQILVEEHAVTARQ